MHSNHISGYTAENLGELCVPGRIKAISPGTMELRHLPKLVTNGEHRARSVRNDFMGRRGWKM